MQSLDNDDFSQLRLDLEIVGPSPRPIDNCNLAPGEQAILITSDGKQHAWSSLKFGWRNGNKFQINSRIETLSRSPSWLLSASRAVVPCNGFYEFRKHAGRSLPYLISTGTLLYLAAIAFLDQGFVIVTTKPSKQLAELHQRSPLILSGPDQARSWLSNASFAQFDLPEITSLSVRPVDPLLNDPARKDRKLLEAPRYEQGTLL